MKRNFDLNLLKVFIVLLQEKNTYRAAEVLDTSQSSVSRSLTKLRVLLDDPLFYRDKRGLKLSEKAEVLSQTLPAMYDTLLDTFEATVFKPENYEGKLSIAMNAYIAELYGASIFKRLTSLMPKLTIEILSWNERSTHLIMADHVDIALSFLPMNLPKSITEKKIGSLEFGFIGNKVKFGDIQSTTIEEVAKHPLVTVLIPEYNSQDLRFKQIPEFEDAVNVLLKAHHIAPLLDLAATTNTLFVAPRKLYERVDQQILHFISVKGLSKEIHSADIGMMYNAKNRASPVFKWFEQQISECIGEC